MTANPGIITTAGGVTVEVGTTVECITLADYEADSYVEVAEVEDAGQIGDESATITFTALKDGRVQKLKGPRDAGTVALVCGALPNDPGQDALVAAEATIYNYNFRVTLNDALELGGTGTVLYFSAKVMSKRRNIGNVSNVVKYTFNLGINTAILEVPAT